MNKEELKNLLKKHNIPKLSYWLDGGMPDERLCLDYFDDEWCVFYSQRGMRSGLMKFQTEEDACDYFWKETCLSFSIKES
jgi:hypothetical protein